MSPADTSDPKQTPSQDLPELNLLKEWREPFTVRHFIWLALGSILFHVGVAAFFLSLPPVVPKRQAPIIVADLRKAVTLVAPRVYEPTQKAPNLTKVTHPELDVRSEVETPRSQLPKVLPPAPAPGPVRSAPPPAPAPVIEPAPKIQVAAAPPTPPEVGPLPTPTGATPSAPSPPAAAKPKMAFENVGSSAARQNPNPNPVFQVPKSSVEDSLRAAASQGGGGITVGDTGNDLNSISGFTRSKGQMGSNLQLLSDPAGVDFKPYLIKILGAVRTNWLAVLPESAHMGRRGQVLIQFIIDRRGNVPKLVIASSSGTEAFDRAAVAGVSASNPFPPLPQEYKGDQIRLQLSFTYNGTGR